MPNGVIRFSDFELDSGRYELRYSDRTIKLEKIPMDLLLLLVEANGQLVTREQIIERIWGKDIFLDTEHGINTAIRKIRQALKDDPDQPRFVQTVTGKGYRFIAPLTVDAKAPVNGNGASASARKVYVPDAYPATRRSALVRRIAFGIVTAIALTAVLFVLSVRGWRDRLWRPAKPTIQSLAVLPLENLSGDPSQDYFADGMTDELITMLAKNTGLRVISRTSVMQYKKAQRPLRAIAQELGVDGILEGSIERTGNGIHLNAQLIYAPEDRHLWAESYDRDLSDLTSLQSELAHAIARQVGLTVSVPPNWKRPISPEAHDAYLMGRYYWFAENYQKSREFFQKAIDLQPDYAAAWSGLADAYLAKGVFGGRALRDEVMGPGREAAQRALALDDSVPEAHRTMGAYYFFYRWDWERADQETARAVELNPGLAESHHLRGYVLQVFHRTDEALEEQKKAMDLDPFARPDAMVRALIQARRFDAALAEARLRTEAQPTNSDLHAWLSDAYYYKGMEKESAQELEVSYRLQGNNEAAIALHRGYARGGYKAVLEWQLDDLRRRARKGDASPFHFVWAYAPLKRKEETLRYLEQAYQEREPWLAHIQYLPYLDFVHSEPRYQAIVKKMGLPPAY